MKKRSTIMITALSGIGLSLGLLAGVSLINNNSGTFVTSGNRAPIKLKPMVKPSDPLYSSKQYISMNHVGDIESTWERFTGEGVTIAVIDTGIEADHEDFKSGQILETSRYYYTEWSSNDSYKVYYKAASDYGMSVLSHDWDSDYSEWSTHGSNVAGSAAASMNAVGTVGIAPNAKILALKIDFYDPSISAAIKYAADQGADIINMSLGGYEDSFDYTYDGETYHEEGYEGTSTAFASAINYAYNKGCIVVAAAGNENTSTYSYPASNNHVIGVGALERNTGSTRADFSNYNKNTDTASGNHNVDVVAPGYVHAPGAYGTKSNKTLSYDETQGTSFSSPIVAGAAALWKEKYPNGTPDEFMADLAEKSVDIGATGWDKTFGYGALDVAKLLDIGSETIYFKNNEKSVATNTSSVEIQGHSSSKVTSWISSNPSVATISGSTGSAGDFTATATVLGVGQTIITATNEDGDSATFTLNVSQYVPVTAINTTLASGSEVEVGKKINIGASVYPTNATEQMILYESEDETVATIDDDGIVKGINEGETDIYMMADNDVELEWHVKVVPSTAEDYLITFSDNGSDAPSETSNFLTYITEGADLVNSTNGTKAFKGTVGVKLGSGSASGSITLNLKEEYDITSVTLNAKQYGSDTGYLMVNGHSATSGSLGSVLSDLVFNFSQTTGVITVATSAKRAYLKSITIHAEPKAIVPVESVSLDTNELGLFEGQSDTLVATVFPSNASDQTVTWSSNNENVATVSSSGKITAIKPGTARITVTTTDGGYTDFCDVIVSFYNSIKKAYDDRYADDSDVSCDIYGLYMGYTIDTKSDSSLRYNIYVGNGKYGIVVYNYATAPTWTPFETALHISGTVTEYSYLYEIKSNASINVVTDSTSLNKIEPIVTYHINGTEDPTTFAGQILASRSAIVSGIVTDISGNIDSSADTTITVELANGKTTTVFIKKNASNLSELKAAISLNEEINVKGFTGIHVTSGKSSFQLVAPELIEIDDTYTAELFAQDLLEATNSICADNGASNHSGALSSVWVNLEQNKFATLSNAERDILKNTIPNANGSVIEEAMARYDHICIRYGLNDFIDRGVSSSNNQLIQFNANNYSFIIIIIALIGAVSLGGYFIVRRKRTY